MKRIAAVRARLREMQIDEHRARDSGPPCTSCMFGPNKADGDGLCDHIAHWERIHDPASGKWKGSPKVATAQARSPEGLCGPEGLLFQPYTPMQKAVRLLSKVNLGWFILVPLLATGLAVALITGQ